MPLYYEVTRATERGDFNVTAPRKDEIFSLLAPYHSTIGDCIGRAWKQYVSLLQNMPITSPRTRANLLWDWIIGFLKTDFAQTSVNFQDINQTTWFYISQDVVFRIKKCDEDGFTRNYPTQNALAYYDQDPNLEDMFPIIRLDIGYIVDDLGTAIKDIRVIFRTGSRVEWKYSILDSMSEIIDLPAAQEPQKSRKVKPKADKAIQPIDDEAASNGDTKP